MSPERPSGSESDERAEDAVEAVAPSQAEAEAPSAPEQSGERPPAAEAPGGEPAAGEPAAEAPKRRRVRRAAKARPAEAAEKPEEAEPAPAKPRAKKAPVAETEKAAAPAPAPRRSKPGRARRRVVRARARYVRAPARKARVVSAHLPGKSVAEARAILAFTPREVARDWSKLLESAVANAENNHELLEEDLIIREAYADEGPTIKRFRPRAMGRATPVLKRMSHLTITLSARDDTSKS
jgi:ribosomal protein L22